MLFPILAAARHSGCFEAWRLCRSPRKIKAAVNPTSSGCCSVNLARFFSASQTHGMSVANRRFISFSVRWLLLGCNAQTIGRVMILLTPKIYRVFSPISLNMTGQSSASQPLPILQPITLYALPWPGSRPSIVMGQLTRQHRMRRRWSHHRLLWRWDRCRPYHWQEIW